jgi:uncharacterized protein YegL
MGAAIQNAVKLVAERKAAYKANGIGYYRPWVFLITDGAPTDNVSAATAAIREGEASKSLMFYAVGLTEADMSRLAQISVCQPLKLRGLSFETVVCCQALGVYRAHSPATVPLTNPTAPNGWAVVD